MRTKCIYQRQVDVISTIKDVLSTRLRGNLPAGHSLQLLSSEEALTNHPSEHGSNLYSPTLWMANPDFLKADSRPGINAWSEMSIYSESSCSGLLKWKIREKRQNKCYLGLMIKRKNSCTNSNFSYLCCYAN